MLEQEKNEGHWIAISDLMSGLMMIFLFIAVSFMHRTNEDKVKISEKVTEYVTLQNELYNALLEEFEPNLADWSATIDKETLAVRFEEPSVLFDKGDNRLKDEFKVILNDFFPRYVLILTSPKFIGDIEEIRIEGHTSSEWTIVKDQTPYISNMNLSQGRARKVLYHLLTESGLDFDYAWVRGHISASGLSSSKLIYEDNIENKKRSRRVEFRVRTNAEKRISEIERMITDG